MPIVLFRVDERLIHGQVVVGWGGRLNADRIVVIDDEIAESPWEQELYCLGVPAEIEASFVTVDVAQRSWSGWKSAPHRLVILVRNVATLGKLANDRLLRGEEVNLGGIHHAPGRERILPYLYLSVDERNELKRVAATGAELSARDLPGSRRVPLEELLAGM
jgi:mannose/fructose/N-acetylgalactosamine-specific phosphotransferase system component IIB